MTTAPSSRRASLWLIVITGLGFFVDSFDAFSYNVMRTPSLTELGLSGDALTRTGMIILNWQVFGVLLGGFVWGLLGDLIGRKQALLGSILVYSLAMVANAFVHDITLYTILRFLVGFGIAGEMGLAAALVGETLSRDKRTFGLAFMTILGLLGVMAAALAIAFFHWRTLCLMGGVGGLALLVLRGLLMESPLFTAAEKAGSFIAPLRIIFTSRTLLQRYIACALLLAPNFFLTGVVLTLSPELAKNLQIIDPVKANIAIGTYFTVAAFGDLFGAWLAVKFHSRKRAIAFFMLGNLALILFYLHGLNGAAPLVFYGMGAVIGLFNLWALSATIAVEQFPTALRATATTSVLTLGRSLIMVFNLILLTLKPAFGLAGGLTIIAIGIFGIGFIVACMIRETHAADLEAISF